MSLPLIAIDGPAGAGKSASAREVARRLGIPSLDTGALYRAAAWAVKMRNIDLNNTSAVARAVESMQYFILDSPAGTRIWINNQDATPYLRLSEITKAAGPVCEIPEVRRRLVTLQRVWAERGFGVMEGRDIGTVVLPKAGLKIFLTARPEVRVKRRARDLNLSEDPQTLAQLAEDLTKRDRRDVERSDSPLRPAADAILLDTSDLTLAKQVNFIIRLAADRFRLKLYSAVDYA